MYQALAAIVFIALRVRWVRAEAGSRPGGRGTFLCFAKETYPKERRPCSLRPFASLRATCGARSWGAPWNSLRAGALRSDNYGESVDISMRAPTRMLTPQPPRRRRSQKGWAAKQPISQTAKQPHGPLLRSAHTARAQAPRAAQTGPSEAMARRDVRSRVPFRMRRGAQRPADQGSRLSERNAVERVRARPRWTRAPQVARSEAQGRSV